MMGWVLSQQHFCDHDRWIVLVVSVSKSGDLLLYVFWRPKEHLPRTHEFSYSLGTLLVDLANCKAQRDLCLGVSHSALNKIGMQSTQND